MVVSAPLDYFLHSHGPASQPTLVLGWVFTGLVLAICLIVGLLLLLAIVRPRPARDSNDIRRDGQPIPWVYIGTGVSIGLLFGMTIYALMALNAVAHPPATPAPLTIHVTGYDWWWKVDYPAANGNAAFTTANEIHIPTGVPVQIALDSADVIHAFWVPQLAGKTEMIPGVSNHQWLEADTPGIYRGQCSQFCGLQHAHMAFEVVAESPQDYARWRQAQNRPAAPPLNAEAEAGSRIFMDHCSGCHTINGTQAHGLHGPDLTHLMSRRQIAAGTLNTTAANLKLWISHPHSVKPGAQMPDTALPPDQARQLITYLTELP